MLSELEINKMNNFSNAIIKSVKKICAEKKYHEIMRNMIKDLQTLLEPELIVGSKTELATGQKMITVLKRVPEPKTELVYEPKTELVSESKTELMTEPKTQLVSEVKYEDFIDFQTKKINSKNGKTFFLIINQTIPIEDTTIDAIDGKIELYFESSGPYHTYNRRSAAWYLGYDPDKAERYLPKHIAYNSSKTPNETFLNIINKDGHTMSIHEVASYHGITIQYEKVQCRNYAQGSCSRGDKCNFAHTNSVKGTRKLPMHY